MANYILFGKDETGLSMVDRKEIQIKTKYSSYSKSAPQSLDSLLEQPTFNENEIIKGKNVYKKIKPTIDKEKAKNIPGMENLWKDIDRMDSVIKQNKGEVPMEEGTPKLSDKELYNWKHQLIDLRKQQYYLMDSYFPTMLPIKNKLEYYENPINNHLAFYVFPRGICKGKNDLDFGKRPKGNKQNLKLAAEPNDFDFTNPEHIVQLTSHYWDIKEMVRLQPDSPLNFLLDTLDFYYGKAELNKQQMAIVEGKKIRLSNKGIRQKLVAELGINHQENYISTIWRKIAGLVAAAAELHFDEWLARDYDKAWKICRCCGEEKLVDVRNFVRKAGNFDGLTNCCKSCDKEKRKAKKAKSKKEASSNGSKNVE